MLLYHYCSNDTFLSILRNSELWLSELTLSNDSMEGAWVWEMLKEECQKRNLSPHVLNDFVKDATFFLELFGVVGFCLSAEGDLLSQWRGYADNGAGIALGFDRRITKELCDSTGKKKINTFLKRVIYDHQEQMISMKNNAHIFFNFFGYKLAQNPSAFQRFSKFHFAGEYSKAEQMNQIYLRHLIIIAETLFTHKNPAFSEEKEWRIMSMITKNHRR